MTRRNLKSKSTRYRKKNTQKEKKSTFTLHNQVYASICVLSFVSEYNIIIICMCLCILIVIDINSRRQERKTNKHLHSYNCVDFPKQDQQPTQYVTTLPTVTFIHTIYTIILISY